MEEKINFNEIRLDGRHVLSPCIGSINGTEDTPISSDDTHLLQLFHNETHDVESYPLSVEEGTYFSEVLGQRNTSAQEYRNLISNTIAIVKKYYSDGAVPFESIRALGNEIEQNDMLFAVSHVQSEPDDIHRCCGTDASHPYAKITILRTTMKIRVHEVVHKLFLEKFLVSYSYLDDKGQRKTTTTPIHSHPPNVEVGYFGTYGEKSKAVEEQFEIECGGESLFEKNGGLKSAMVKDQKILGKCRLRHGVQYDILPCPKPFLFPPSPLDEAAFQNSDAFLSLTGLLRPHQVTVIDDPLKGTSFFSVITYFTPVAEVVVYEDDGTPRTKKWSYAEWAGNDKM